MALNKKYTWAWIAWVLLFGVIEYAALKDKREGDTLTEHVRQLIGTWGKKDLGNWIARVSLAGLFVWLVPHFFTGAW